MARVEIDDDALDRIRVRVSTTLDRICAEIAKDARDICPVGVEPDDAEGYTHLRDTIGSEVHGTTGRVGSNKDYAAAVEMGFHGIEHVREYRRRDGTRVRAHDRHANQPSEPYLRPALYARRSG